MNYALKFMTLYRRQWANHPQEKEMQKTKCLSKEALQIAVKRREAKDKGEKERYTHLNPYKTWNFRISLCLHLFTQFYLQNTIFFSLLLFSLKKKILKICQSNLNYGSCINCFGVHYIQLLIFFFFFRHLISSKWKMHHFHAFVSL